ncbi:MAG: hypothetical protein AMXMBFR23_24100 [Chloroflexota bacterium]
MVTAALAPGLMTAPASPAANAPPGGPPAPAGPAGTFAALLAAVNAATQPGGEPAAPPGGGVSGQSPDMDALMALLEGLTATPPGEEMAGLTDSTQTMPLLDRPAGVEALPTGTEPGSAALEALMAALLLARPQPVPTEEHSLPGGDLVLLDVTAASAAVASMTADTTEVTQPLATAVSLATPDAGDVPASVIAQAAAVADAAMEANAPADEAGVEPAVLLNAYRPTTSDGTPKAAMSDALEADGVMSRLTAPPDSDASASASEAATAHLEPETVEVRSQPSGGDRTANVVPVTPQVAPADTAIRAEPVVRAVPAANAPVEVAETVTAAVINGDAEVHLRLDPPDLGTLDVHIERQDGAIRIRVEASQASSREVIERALPALQQALESRDLRVERLEVRSMSESASGRSMTDQGGQFGRGGQPSQQDGTPEWSPVAAIEGVRRDAAQRPVGQPSGGLDVMA